MLHRVTCRHIRQANSGSQNWTRLYAKVCSLDREELTSWAETHTGAASNPCAICKPDQSLERETAPLSVRIAELACEGGGEVLYGRREGDRWVYWTEGSSMTMDEDDTDYNHSWQSDEKGNPLEALSRQWILLSPIYVNPDYLDVFRLGCKQASSALTEEEQRIFARWTQARWLRLLYNKAEAWPEDE